MTSNIYNPQLGDMGSSASTVAPTEDRSVVMAEAEELRQEQDTASDFNALTNGMFSIAPVIRDMAAKRYVAKNLVGTDGAADVADATQEEVVRQKQQNDVFDLVHVQKTLAVNEIKTFSGLEAARAQGSISWDEMQLRAATQRAESIQRAPLYAEQIDAAYRSVVGGSTGTASMGQATLWNKTPEEKQMDAYRQEVTSYALKYQITPAQAADQIAYDLNLERQVDVAPMNEAEFSTKTSNKLLQAGLTVKKRIFALKDDQGNFTAQEIRQETLLLENWEDDAVFDLNTDVSALLDKGIIISQDVIKASRASITAEKESLIAMMSNNDEVSFWKNNKDLAVAQQSLYVMKHFPTLSLAKEMGVDYQKFVTDVGNSKILQTLVKTDPRYRELLALSNGDFRSAAFMQTAEYMAAVVGGGEYSTEDPTTGATVPVEEQKEQPKSVSLVIGAALSVSAASAETMVTLSIAGNNGKGLIDAVTNDPDQIRAYQDVVDWKVKPTDEFMGKIFGGASAGIEGYILSSKSRNEPVDYYLSADENGTIKLEGTGITSKARGQVQELYDTILAHPNVWKSQAETPSLYLQGLFAQRKFTLDGKTSSMVDALRESDQSTLVQQISSNMDAYVTSPEDADAVAEMLYQRKRSLPRTVGSSVELAELEMMQVEFESYWDDGKVVNANPAVVKQVSPMVDALVSGGNTEAQINTMLESSGVGWDEKSNTYYRAIPKKTTSKKNLREGLGTDVTAYTKQQADADLNAEIDAQILANKKASPVNELEAMEPNIRNYVTFLGVDAVNAKLAKAGLFWDGKKLTKVG